MHKSMVILLLGILATGSFSLVSKAGAPTEIEQTWVRMRGLITQWGETPVFGFINAHARMVSVNDTDREWAGVHAVWSDSPRHINCTDPPTGDFTYVFYFAGLVNSSVIELNYRDNDFYVSGLWNVYKVTIEFSIDEFGNLISYSKTLEAIVIKGEGDFRVFNEWSDFVLGITGIDPLSGSRIRYAVGHMEIRICDINGDYVVGLQDLVGVAKRYGSMPGLGNYSFEMDFNYDFTIDIYDLTTLAANIEG